MAYHEIMVTDSNKMGKIVGYNAKYTNTTIVHPLSDLCLVLAQFYNHSTTYIQLDALPSPWCASEHELGTRMHLKDLGTHPR